VRQRRGDDDLEPLYPVWSRDGGTIYYKANDRGRNSSIWAVLVWGETPRLVVRFERARAEIAAEGVRHRWKTLLFHRGARRERSVGVELEKK